jgi:hypothetical protein
MLLANVVILSHVYYVGQSKGTLYLKVEPSSLVSLHKFQILFWVMGQLNCLIEKKKKKNQAVCEIVALAIYIKNVPS